MTGRAVLITGASRGIGRAIALAFATHGDHVAVHHRDSGDRAAAVLAELPGEGHMIVQGDLADPAQVRRLVDAAAVGLGGLDVLVNNAGIFVTHPITEVSYEDWQAAWQQTLAVNLIGPANMTWCAVQHMIPRGGGRIINVSSRGAFRGEPGQPAYGASKGALNSFGQSLALALGPHGISVTAVAPGFVDTEMTRGLSDEHREQITRRSALRRLAEVEDVAAAVEYLLSVGARNVTGTVLTVDAGNTA